jgi:hypothetical protein
VLSSTYREDAQPIKCSTNFDESDEGLERVMSSAPRGLTFMEIQPESLVRRHPTRGSMRVSVRMSACAGCSLADVQRTNVRPSRTTLGCGDTVIEYENE